MIAFERHYPRALVACALLALTVVLAACVESQPQDLQQADRTEPAQPAERAEATAARSSDEQSGQAEGGRADPPAAHLQGAREQAANAEDARDGSHDSSSPEAAESGFELNADTTWREMFERRLGPGERACIRDAFAVDELQSVLARPVASENDPEPWDVEIFACLEPGTARSIYLSVLLTELQEEDPAFALTPREESCLRTWVAELDVAGLVAVSAAGDAIGTEAWPEEFYGVFACIPRLFIGVALGDSGAEVSEAESACLIEWAADLDWGALFAGLETEDLGAFGEFMDGLSACVPDLFVSLILADEGIELDDLSEEQQTCLREWSAALDWNELLADAEEDIFALASIGLGLYECAPELVDALDAQPQADRPEIDIPDDHADVIEQATPAVIGEPASGRVDYEGDADYFVFQAAAERMYRIDVELDTLSDSVAVVYSALGGELARNDDHDGSTASRIFWPAERSGPLYVQVTGFSTETGSYRLRISESEFSDDHANSAERATPVAVGAATDGLLEYADDVDYFVFDAVVGRLYQIDVALGTLTDSQATLYDNTDGWPLISNDDHAGSAASRIYWEATDSVPHYVEVSGFGDVAGTYTLTIIER